MNSQTGANTVDHGQGKLVTMAPYQQSVYEVHQDGTSRWYEIQDTAGGNQCLTLTGSVSTGFRVTTESCNLRSSELWWFHSGLHALATQIQNQYGTTLLKHDACLVDTGSGTNPRVTDCQSGQHNDQVWTAYF